MTVTMITISSSYAAIAALSATAYARNLALPDPTSAMSLPQDGISPKPTAAPLGPHGLFLRASCSKFDGTMLVAPDNTCGYIYGSSGAWITCPSTYSCAFLMPAKHQYGAVGCCNTLSCGTIDSCVDFIDYSKSSKCDNPCQVDGNILKWYTTFVNLPINLKSKVRLTRLVPTNRLHIAIHSPTRAVLRTSFAIVSISLLRSLLIQLTSARLTPDHSRLFPVPPLLLRIRARLRLLRLPQRQSALLLVVLSAVLPPLVLLASVSSSSSVTGRRGRIRTASIPFLLPTPARPTQATRPAHSPSLQPIPLFAKPRQAPASQTPVMCIQTNNHRSSIRAVSTSNRPRSTKPPATPRTCTADRCRSFLSAHYRVRIFFGKVWRCVASSFCRDFRYLLRSHPEF